MLVVATGCNDYLDIPVEAKKPVETIDYTDMSVPSNILMGAYSHVASTAGSWSRLGINAIRGDDVEKGNPSPSDQYTLTMFHNFDYSEAATYWAVGGAWNDEFQAISDMNEGIAALEKFIETTNSEADKATLTKYIAQIRVLRAYEYFMAARLFGDVPVFTKNSEKEGLRRSTFEHVIQFIISECKEASISLDKIKPNQMNPKGSVTRYTALAIMAKAAAEILDYETVLTATEEIISAYGEKSLYPDFLNLFNGNGILCDENLLEAQFSSTTNPQTFDDNYFAFQGPAQPIHSKVKLNGANLNGGWGFLPPTDKLVKFMKSRGETVRYTASIINVGEETYAGDTLVTDPSRPYPSRYSGKAYQPSALMLQTANWWGSDNSVRMIRYADILLLNAEAKVQKGQNGDIPFNWVRKRAKMPELTNVTFQQVMDERFAELCLENGERYYDLARTGLAKKELSNYSEAKRFYPVPQSVLDADAFLKEEPQ